MNWALKFHSNPWTVHQCILYTIPLFKHSFYLLLRRNKHFTHKLFMPKEIYGQFIQLLDCSLTMAFHLTRISIFSNEIWIVRFLQSNLLSTKPHEKQLFSRLLVKKQPTQESGKHVFQHLKNLTANSGASEFVGLDTAIKMEASPRGIFHALWKSHYTELPGMNTPKNERHSIPRAGSQRY